MASDVVLDDYVLDNELGVLDTAADKIYICSGEPSDFTAASSTLALGVKDFGSAGAAFAAPAAGSPDGRQTTSNAVTNGTVTATGTVTRWAVVASGIGGGQLLAHGAFTGAGSVTNGQAWNARCFHHSDASNSIEKCPLPALRKS